MALSFAVVLIPVAADDDATAVQRQIIGCACAAANVISPHTIMNSSLLIFYQWIWRKDTCFPLFGKIIDRKRICCPGFCVVRNLYYLCSWFIEGIP